MMKISESDNNSLPLTTNFFVFEIVVSFMIGVDVLRKFGNFLNQERYCNSTKENEETAVAGT